MRILTLSTLYPSASRPNFGIFVEQQTRALAAREGVELIVVNPVGVPPPPFDRIGRYARLAALPVKEEWRGLTVHRPRFRIVPRVGAGLFPAAVAAAAAPIVRAFAPDLIDAEFFWPDGPAAARLARRFGLPYTIKARGGDIMHWGQQRHARRAMVAAAKSAAAMLSVSDALKADMVALGMNAHGEADRIRIHRTGLDRTRFAPIDRAEAKRTLGFGGPLVVSLGALIPIKGQALLIEALPQLPGVTLMLVGGGPMEEEYRALGQRLGVADRLIVRGQVPHAELPPILAAADVMALMSSREGLANAWVEALAMGTPLVIPDVGGARELLRDSAAGHIVERTPDAAAEAIRALIAAPPPPDTVRAAVEGYAWTRNADELEALFRAIVARGKPASA